MYFCNCNQFTFGKSSYSVEMDSATAENRHSNTMDSTDTPPQTRLTSWGTTIDVDANTYKATKKTEVVIPEVVIHE